MLSLWGRNFWCTFQKLDGLTLLRVSIRLGKKPGTIPSFFSFSPIIYQTISLPCAYWAMRYDIGNYLFVEHIRYGRKIYFLFLYLDFSYVSLPFLVWYSCGKVPVCDIRVVFPISPLYGLYFAFLRLPYNSISAISFRTVIWLRIILSLRSCEIFDDNYSVLYAGYIFCWLPILASS